MKRNGFCVKTKKRVAAVLTAALCAVVLFCFSACDLFPQANEDNRENIVKPDISKAASDYESQTIKGSEAVAKAEFSIYKKGNGKVLPIKTEQIFEILRISDADRIFVDSTLRSGATDASLVELYKNIRNTLAKEDEPYDATTDPVVEYLQGSSDFRFRVGWNDFYNVKGEYRSEKNGFSRFFGFDDKVIKDAAGDIVTDFVLSESLVSSGLLDFKKASEWVAKDDGSRYFSTEKNKFVYLLDVDEGKLGTMLKEELNRLAPFLAYADIPSETYEKVVKTVSKWVKINPSNVTALVSANGLPDKTTTECSFDVNVNLTQLDEVLYFIFGKDKKEEISKLIRIAVLGLNLCGTNGEDNTVGFRVSFRSEESFRYGAQCSFEGSEEFFVGADEEAEGRKILAPDDLKAIPARLAALIAGQTNDKAE
ncbi:MAG: hypothetical protein ACI4SK_06330 [Christensenellales bacterium]